MRHVPCRFDSFHRSSSREDVFVKAVCGKTARLSGGRRPAPAGRASSDPTPVKAANKGAPTPAESPEGRASTKGNLRDQSTHRTQGRDGVSQAVERIRQAATPRGLPSTTPGGSRMR